MPFVPAPGRQRQTSLGAPGQPGLHSKVLLITYPSGSSSLIGFNRCWHCACVACQISTYGAAAGRNRVISVYCDDFIVP